MALGKAFATSRGFCAFAHAHDGLALALCNPCPKVVRA